MGWLIAAGVLLMLWFLPLCIRLSYDVNGAGILLLVGPLRFRLYSSKADTGKQKQDKEKAKPHATAVQESTNRGEGGAWSDFVPLVKMVLQLLDSFGRKLVIKNLKFKLTLAGEDPCDLSINYGRAWAAVGNLFPHLARFFVIKKRNIEVLCDYLCDETTVIAKVDFSITVGRILSVAVYYGIPGIKHYLHIMNKRKGGANT